MEWSAQATLHSTAIPRIRRSVRVPSFDGPGSWHYLPSDITTRRNAFTFFGRSAPDAEKSRIILRMTSPWFWEAKIKSMIEDDSSCTFMSGLYSSGVGTWLDDM